MLNYMAPSKFGKEDDQQKLEQFLKKASGGGVRERFQKYNEMYNSYFFT